MKRVALVLLALSCGTAHAQVIAQSTFPSNREGWYGDT